MGATDQGVKDKGIEDQEGVARGGGEAQQQEGTGHPGQEGSRIMGQAG